MFHVGGQEVKVASDKFPCLKEALVCNQFDGNKYEIDLLIGSDCYWTIINNEVKRYNQEGLVAINSKLGWILSGPVISQKTSSIVVNVTRVMNIEVEVDKDCQLNEKIEKFWDLDSVGVVEKEQSVYDKSIKEITLKDNRYEVRLPFKEGHPLNRR